MIFVQASFKKLIEDGPSGKGSQRLIPVLFDLDPDDFRRCLPHLCVSEFLRFGTDYEHDVRGKHKLVSVIRDHAALTDPSVKYIAPYPELRGPSQLPPETLVTGEMAGNFSLNTNEASIAVLQA